ncbi:hypothetical protein ACFLZI_03545 [Nitrospirota bacterium]
MKLSKIVQYQEYMFSVIKKQYAEAEHSLDFCIVLAKEGVDCYTHSFLLQNKGDLYYLKGENKKAIQYYQESERVAEGAALPMYHFAKFMADSLHEYSQAIDKCQEVIDLVSSAEWTNGDDELDKNYYLAQCNALQGFLYALGEDFPNALLCLKQLLPIKTIFTLNYDLKLCEALKKKGFYKEVQPYLKNLLKKAEKSLDQEEFAGYIAEIKRLLTESQERTSGDDSDF